MHFNGDENYNRGYEWWLMKEARKRNPDVKLYGLSWAWPGFLGVGGSSDQPAKNPFTDVNATANYSVSWLLGAKKVHDLDVDYIGLWNERSSPQPYVDALTAALKVLVLLSRVYYNVIKEHAPSVQIAGGPHYPGTSLKAENCSSYPWNASRWVDEEGSVADGQSARCLARCINRNYLTGMFAMVVAG